MKNGDSSAYGDWSGMTKKEHVAAMVMAGVMANRSSNTPDEELRNVAVFSRRVADELLDGETKIQDLDALEREYANVATGLGLPLNDSVAAVFDWLRGRGARK
ncbi:MAG: hypothetical protein OK454_07185 [Thaumarchaeota archaeon]|nr:hypothetical protein [Nitrososphaerota archaeon]